MEFKNAGERIGEFVFGRRQLQEEARIDKHEARGAGVGERGLKRQKGAPSTLR